LERKNKIWHYDGCFVLDQHTELNLKCSITLMKQSAGRHDSILTKLFFLNRSNKNYITYKSDSGLQMTGVHNLSYYAKRKITLSMKWPNVLTIPNMRYYTSCSITLMKQSAGRHDSILTKLFWFKANQPFLHTP
jgi:hypothetical protein